MLQIDGLKMTPFMKCPFAQLNSKLLIAGLGIPQSIARELEGEPEKLVAEQIQGTGDENPGVVPGLDS
jgi:hypothetical protein